MSVILNFEPEIEAGLAANARAAGVTLEVYLQRLAERVLCVEGSDNTLQEESGMVWEDELLIYGAGSVLPEGFIEASIRRARGERSRHLLGLDN